MLLSVRDVYKSYQSVTAVDGVNLEIPRGVSYGLLGPNGAGKSTLISILASVSTPDKGTVELDGRPLGATYLDNKRKIGYVPQELALYEDLSAIENLNFFGLMYDLTGSQLKERVENSLQVAGLQNRSKGPVKAFSGGMKRRLNIAIALIHNPEFIILDEPTVGVDPQSRNLIFETLEALVLDGKTLLYTTHYMEEVERLCERVAIMDKGKIIAEGKVSELYKMVPAEKLVEIQLSAPSEQDFALISGVLNVQREGPVLTLQLENLSTDLPRVLTSIADAGSVVESVRSYRPSLETVFLHLTGRRLRD